MKYLLMAYVNEGGFAALTKDQQQQGAAAYMAYGEALAKAGVVKGSNRLQPTSAATTVRVENGKSQVLDGPYADSKEQVGGYYLIDVPHLYVEHSCAARGTATRHITGNLVAFLAARTHDVAAAEDALSEAFASALASWPQNGCPENPEAWLLTVARRKLIDNIRTEHRDQNQSATEQLHVMDEIFAADPP